MKITTHRHFPPAPAPEHSSGGVKNFASYSRIILTMIDAGEIRLRPGEYISEVAVMDKGLEFTIGTSE